MKEADVMDSRVTGFNFIPTNKGQSKKDANKPAETGKADAVHGSDQTNHTEDNRIQNRADNMEGHRAAQEGKRNTWLYYPVPGVHYGHNTELLRPKKGHVDEEPVVEEPVIEKPPVDDVPVETPPVDEAPIIEDSPVNEVPAEILPIEDISVEDVPVDDVSGEVAPIEDTPVEKPPVDGVSVETPPIDDVPLEDLPSDSSSTDPVSESDVDMVYDEPVV